MLEPGDAVDRLVVAGRVLLSLSSGGKYLRGWSLKDGTLLCALANAIQPGVVPHCAESPATSVEEMENIGIFLSAAAKLGVEEENLITSNV